ncbi:MAG: tetratricopeptide repeat protein, partial [Allorhizobium sp.]
WALDTEGKDASTLYQLAGLALKGMITDAAPGLGLDLMTQAAEAGKVEAMRELGRIYLAGTDTAADLPKALHWLSLAARGGESEALDTMVELVLAQSMPSNLRAAALEDVVQALERRALGSSREAALTLSRLYGMMGESDPAYREKARTWLAKAAELGDASAMLQLSDAYATGTYGFEVSAELSTAWLAKSAKAGHPEAFERYAIALQMGYGTAPDPREADVWMAKAAVKTQ